MVPDRTKLCTINLQAEGKPDRTVPRRVNFQSKRVPKSQPWVRATNQSEKWKIWQACE